MTLVGVRLARMAPAAALVVALALPAPAASAVPLAAAARAKRAVSAAQLRSAAVTSAPLPSSPVSGSVDAAGDASDVFTVALLPGDRLTVEVTGAAGTDVDLYLLWPTAVSLSGFDLAAAGTSMSYPERIAFDCAQGGTYYLHVHCASGAGWYAMKWTRGRATAAPVIDRAAGPTRYETAVSASEHAYAPGTSRDVVLASGELFPDALTASGLAGALGCPVLLTRQASLPTSVVPELVRLGVTDVHVVGGTAAVSDAVCADLAARGYATYRYGGADRYETSAIIANAVRVLRGGPPPIVFIARGDLFPDALSVSPIAYQHAYPVVLSRASGVPPSVRQALESARPATVVIAGGTSAITTFVEGQVRALSFRPAVVRKGGPTRYETAVEVAGFAVSRYLAVPDRMAFASGELFPDALVGGAGIGHFGGMLLLTTKDAFHATSRTALAEWARLGLVDKVTIYGGPAAVGAAAETGIRAVLR